jgi:hypothetical protein
MDDATIRAVLRDVGGVKFGTPSGHLSVTRGDLVARGVDFEEVARWAEGRDGYVERSEYRRQGLGPSYGKLDVHVRLIVPEAALRD